MNTATATPAVDQAEHERDTRLRNLGAVIRDARGEMAQAELGTLLGGIPQTTISRWERGLVELSVEQVLDLERALRLAPGTLLTAAGYVRAHFNATDVESILRADPAIHPDVRTDLINMYKSYVKISQRLSVSEARPSSASNRRRSLRS